MKTPKNIKPILPNRMSYSTYDYHSLGIRKFKNGSFKAYYKCTNKLCNFKIRKCVDEGFYTEHAAYFEIPPNQNHICREPIVEIIEPSEEEENNSYIVDEGRKIFP